MRRDCPDWILTATNKNGLLVEIDASDATTLLICEVVEIEGKPEAGPVLFVVNEDRFGYVNPVFGNQRWEKALERSESVIRRHNEGNQ